MFSLFRKMKSQLPFSYEEMFLQEIERNFVPKEVRNKPRTYKPNGCIIYRGVAYCSERLRGFCGEYKGEFGFPLTLISNLKAEVR